MQQATEQLGQLVALGNQQDAAVQRLAVLIEVLSGSGKREDAAGVVLSKQPLLDTSAENEGEGDVNARLDEPHAEPKPERDPQPASRSRSRKQAVPLQSQAPTARKHAVEPVLVSSIVDPKRPSRFYTSIRLSRDLWDRSGFGASDRLQIDWTGEILSIARVTEGGVKPKKVGDKVVVLQSWRLGDLNFAQAAVAAEPDGLRLRTD
jgi:hypothetical protein